MSDPASLASLFAAAEQAAMSGDFAAAARCLGDAARAQEAALGPDHLELANTLNNLAVAHERSGQLDDAEREYRRAYAIAARTLPADHPQVTTSALNLREFCEATGRSVDGPPLRLADDRDPAADAARAVAMAEPRQADVPTAPIEPLTITFAAEGAPSQTSPARKGPAPQAPVQPSTSPTPARPAARTPAPTPAPAPPPTAAPAAKPTPAPVAAETAKPTPAPRRVEIPARPAPARRSWLPVLLVLGTLGVLVIWLLARGPADPPATPQAATPEGSPPLTPAATPTPPPAREAATPRPSTTAATAGGITVGEARLCTVLAPGYRCEAAASPVRAGSLTFYTRIVASSDTSVVHRWYRGNELRQAVRLDVPPRRSGFRTFSRATVSRSDGEWRVELRSRDGRLLHTETFTVR